MHLSIGKRIVAGFASLIILTVLLGGYQFTNIGQMRDFADRIVEKQMKAVQLVGDLSAAQRDMRVYRERAVAMSLGRSDLDQDNDGNEAQRNWREAYQRTSAILAKIEDLASLHASDSIESGADEYWSNVLEAAKQSKDALLHISDEVTKQFERMNSGRTQSLEAENQALADLRNTFNAEVSDIEELVLQLAENTTSEIGDTHADITNASVIALIIVTLLGTLVAYLIHRSIMRPLVDFMRFVETIGSGDLRVRTRNTGSDELGQLGIHLNEMADNLAASAQQTRAGTEQLNSATAELRAATQQQASSTSEQNAAIQQITSTLEEINQSGAQMTDRARIVLESSKATSETSRAGLEAAGETARIMRSVKDQAETVAQNIVSLTEKTQSVGEIIASVNDIAERSDLLALNAAIEASAAGEVGKSFSVVAEEMKVLAGQAKEATQQVRGILNDIQQGISTSVMQTEEAVKRSESGQKQTDEMEATITSLAENIEQSVATFEQIVAANNQQQIGIEQVSQSIRSIREASEQMTSGTRDLEQSATSLASLAEQLQSASERYKT